MGDGDVMGLLRGAIDRIKHVHGYKGWILVEAEQDPKIAPPLEYAHIARDYVKGTLLGQ